MEEEDTTIEISNEELEGIQRKGDLCLIGKIWVEWMVGRTTIKVTMEKIWKLSSKAWFQKVSLNTFVIQFSIHANKQIVEDGRPCLCDSNNFAIEQLDDLHNQNT